MSTQQNKGFKGYLTIKKTAGQTTPAVGTIFTFPVATIQPRNPANIQYLQCVNSSGFLSIKVPGKKTPSLSAIGIPLKTSFFAGVAGVNMVSDLIGAATSFLDTNNNSSEYNLGVNNGSSTRYYQGAKCNAISFYNQADGGPILMDLSFLTMAGDSENSPLTIATPSVDGGTAEDITSISVNSTVDPPYQWRLDLLRPQAFQFEADGTLYSDTLQSGMFGGGWSYTQSPLGVVVPSATVTMQFNVGGGAGNAIQMVLNVNLDQYLEDVIPALGRGSRTYTLFNSGAAPITLTNF